MLILGEGCQEVLEDNSEILEAFRDWYEKHRYHIQLPNGEIGMVSLEGRTETNIKDDGLNPVLQYYDHVIAKTFSFNPFTEEAEIDSEEAKDLKTSDLRKALITELDNYTTKNFSQGKIKYNIY